MTRDEYSREIATSFVCKYTTISRTRLHPAIDPVLRPVEVSGWVCIEGQCKDPREEGRKSLATDHNTKNGRTLERAHVGAARRGMEQREAAGAGEGKSVGVRGPLRHKRLWWGCHDPRRRLSKY